MAASSSFLRGDTGAFVVSSATGVHAPVSLSTRYSRPFASCFFSKRPPAGYETGWRAFGDDGGYLRFQRFDARGTRKTAELLRQTEDY